MFTQQLPAFSNVVASGIATLRIPSFDLTLVRMMLVLGGTTFTKAMITDIKLKIGARTVYQTTGPQLDRINRYKGIFDQANFLTIDFSERDQPDVNLRELGGYSLPALRALGDLTCEVTIAGATAPTLTALANWNAPQDNPVIMKLISFPSPSAVAGRFPINLQLSGALVKRLHLIYAGTDWTASADGNINRVEVKKNGLAVFEMTCLQARHHQQEYRKVPQSRGFVVDFIVDNNFKGHLATQDARSLEINTFLTAGDSVTAIAEVIDNPTNL